jgi:hypothetical protein
VFGGLMTAFPGGSPFVAYAAGRWAAARLSREAQTQRASLRQVPATLLQEPIIGQGRIMARRNSQVPLTIGLAGWRATPSRTPGPATKTASSPQPGS